MCTQRCKYMEGGEDMLNNIINWVCKNHEWIFSGIGVTFLLGMFSLFRKIFCKEKANEKHVIIKQKNGGQNGNQIGIQNNYYGDKKNDR